MRVVNLFGGPGSGKSTTAAALFSQYKYQGRDTELVTEYAKDKVWEKSFNTLGNQIYVFGKQYHRLWRLEGDIEIAVTDSPMLLSLFYGSGESRAFHDLVLEAHHRWSSYNIFLRRVKPYKAAGRTQTEPQAREIDARIRTILDVNNVPYLHVDGDQEAPGKIRDYIRGLDA